MNRSQFAGVLIFFGALQCLVMMAIMEAMVPGYSVNVNYLSDLGVFPQTAHIFTATMVINGLLAFICVILAHDKFGKWLSRLVGVVAIGSIGVGVFPENFMPIAIPTVGSVFPQTGLFHILFAIPTFFCGVIIMLMGYKKFTSPFKYVSVGLGIFMLVALVLMFTGLGGIGRGGMERLVVYPLIFWDVGVGMVLMNTQLLQRYRNRRMGKTAISPNLKHPWRYPGFTQGTHKKEYPAWLHKLF